MGRRPLVPTARPPTSAELTSRIVAQGPRGQPRHDPRTLAATLETWPGNEAATTSYIAEYVVQASPGLTQVEVGRRAGLTLSETRTALQSLRKAGRILRHESRFFASTSTPEVNDVVAGVRQQHRLEILSTVYRIPGIVGTDLRARLRITKQQLSAQSAWLMAAGLLERRRCGPRSFYRVSDDIWSPATQALWRDTLSPGLRAMERASPAEVRALLSAVDVPERRAVHLGGMHLVRTLEPGAAAGDWSLAGYQLRHDVTEDHLLERDVGSAFAPDDDPDWRPVALGRVPAGLSLLGTLRDLRVHSPSLKRGLAMTTHPCRFNRQSHRGNPSPE